MGLIKVLGNETQFRIWIEEFFKRGKVIIERREGGHYYYRKTDRGELFHKLLKSGDLIKLFTGMRGRRLGHSTAVPWLKSEKGTGED